MNELVTQSVLAERFNVTRQSVHGWLADESFPAPAEHVEGVKVFDYEEVCAWFIRTGKELRV